MDKTGRRRRYRLEPPPGFADVELAHAVAWLHELAERVYDQIEDLPLEALDFTPGEITLSIGRLVLHLAWAEATWVRRLSGAPIPPVLLREIERGELARFASPPPRGRSASRLIKLCRRVQSQYSDRALAGVTDIDAVQMKDGSTFSVRGVMGQLAWHWTYHSGQIGLPRLLWGSDYTWRSEEMVAAVPR